MHLKKNNETEITDTELTAGLNNHSQPFCPGFLALKYYLFQYDVLLKLLSQNTHSETPIGHILFFLPVSRSGVRTKVIGSLKIIHLYILRNIQYIEDENNCHEVSNRK